MHNVFVHPLPTFEADELCGAVAVVIDVFRASTTMIAALSCGADAIIPCESVAEAHAACATLPPDRTLLGGERKGQLIDGFDLDNSPGRYTATVVSGKTIIFTTSHGTRALLRSCRASRVLIGAFVNFNAVVRELQREDRPIHFVCAGTDDHVSIEDTLCAACMAGALWTHAGRPAWNDDNTLLALALLESPSLRDEQALAGLFRQGRGGSRLRRLGLDRDIGFALQRSVFDIVPEFSHGRVRIPGEA